MIALLACILTLLAVLVSAVIATGYALITRIDFLINLDTGVQAQSYQTAANTPKKARHFLPTKKTETKGRSVVSQPQLVDFSDVDFETGMAALEKFAEEI